MLEYILVAIQAAGIFTVFSIFKGEISSTPGTIAQQIIGESYGH